MDVVKLVDTDLAGLALHSLAVVSTLLLRLFCKKSCSTCLCIDVCWETGVTARSTGRGLEVPHINRKYLGPMGPLQWLIRGWLHCEDYSLFWHNIRDNVALRLEAFHKVFFFFAPLLPWTAPPCPMNLPSHCRLTALQAKHGKSSSPQLKPSLVARL